MSFSPGILTLAADKISAAINRLLESDPGNAYFIEKLDGVRIHVECTAPAANLFIQFDQSQIRLMNSSETASDLQLSGTSISLIRLLTTPLDNASSLRDSKVSVSGDVGLLLELSRLAKRIEIDWELLLTEQIGETPAVVMSRIFSTGLREAKKFSEDISAAVDKSVRAGTRSLPSKEELKTLKGQLTELNYRLDRLEAQQSNSSAIL